MVSESFRDGAWFCDDLVDPGDKNASGHRSGAVEMSNGEKMPRAA